MVGNPKKGSLKKNSAPRIFFRPMGEINNIFNDIGTIQLRVTFLLARMLHALPSPDLGEGR
jgi:hypothetical protein